MVCKVGVISQLYHLKHITVKNQIFSFLQPRQPVKRKGKEMCLSDLVTQSTVQKNDEPTPFL